MVTDDEFDTPAKMYGAIVWTQDSDFKNLEGVKYFRKV